MTNEINWWKALVFNYSLNVTIAFAILIFGWILAKRLGKLCYQLFVRGGMDIGLVTFLSNLITIGLKVLVIVAAINQVGIATTSILTLLGAAGIAIGLALSGTLSNFVGGMVVLLFKPFRVGDTITAQNQSGKVTEIQIFYTYLLTAENKVAIIPNGILANGSMLNATREEIRRVEWNIHLDKASDFERLKTVLNTFFDSNDLILKEHKVKIEINDISMDSIHVVVQAWSKLEDSQTVQYLFNHYLLQQTTDHSIQLVRK